MSSNTKMATARFERMTKEEKLRFCQDLIRQAAHLSKPSRVSATGSKANAPMVRSKSKSSKRGTSVASATSKKTKSVASTHSGRSKSRDRANLTKPSASKSSRLSSSSQSSAGTKGTRSISKTISQRVSSRSSSRGTKSKSKHSSPSKALSHASLKPTVINPVRSASSTSDNKTGVTKTVSKSAPKRSATRSPTGTRKKSPTKSKSKGRKKSRAPAASSRARSTATARSPKKTNGTKRSKSSMKEKVPSSRTRSVSKSKAANGKARATSSKRSTRKDRTEACLVPFVPKFNPKSTQNQVPIYHLIRRAFGNMVREAICQLDANKSGVSSEKIIEHILQHYHFPDNLSENVIRHRTMFTINSGLRAGTLLTVSPNKSVRIGRMRRVYPRMRS